MSLDEAAAQLNDPWGALVLRRAAVFPGGLDEVLAALDNLNQGGGPVLSQSSFFVSETGHFPINAATAHLDREFRLVISGSNPGGTAVVFISMPAEDRQGLIELISWDSTKQAFNYYRRPAQRQWLWKGDSRDAFRAASAGQGCFACHVHGAPIMKELRTPWNNWHSQAASIPREAIPSEAVRNSPLFADSPAGTRQPAQVLEGMIRGGTSMTIAPRIREFMQGSALTDAPTLLRPLFDTTTVNLASSNVLSRSDTTQLGLPMNFFVNADALGDILQLPTLLSVPVPQIRRDLYAASLARFDFRLAAGPVCDATTFCLKGDTHFAFFVPVPSLGDINWIRELINRNVVTRHFVLSVLMVDFPNPVYSGPRRDLLRYVPSTATVQDGRSDLPEKTADAIVLAAATLPPESPEARFAANWARPPDQLRADADAIVRNYLEAVRNRLATQSGFDDYTRLAQSRRERFASTPLREQFPFLLPGTNIPAASLRMNADGTVTP
jgi:hypothetical protein